MLRFNLIGDERVRHHRRMRAAAQMTRKLRDRDKHRAYMREWEKTRKRPTGKQAEYSRRYREKHALRYRNTQIKHNYGISLEEYDRMAASQRGLCAICQGP